ncbi:hypothetical protein PR048_003557 [Dryococelus australis]|uniref:Uncharacterized protein n=1 Tax=Dryococelus australis TaxID=614101 RepID=A0ABQ9INF7_9NEOP|nr:hypothetical protein PR048_003557 [Dryococelus australis]
MRNAKGCTSSHLEKASTDCNTEHFNQKVYREAIGYLLYLATFTRPDITFTVGKLSRKCHEPSVEDWKGGDKHIVKVFCDADWANDRDPKSMSGYAVFMGNCLVGWKSKRQQEVATSITHAQYISMYEA